MSFKQAMQLAREQSVKLDGQFHVALVRDAKKLRGFIGYTVTQTYDEDTYLLSYQAGRELML